MTEEVSISRLRMRRVLRISRLFGFVQSAVIFLLLIWMAEEYNHNQFFQAWAGARLGDLSFFLNGTLAAFYAGLVIAYYLSAPEERSRLLVKKREDTFVEARATS